MFDNCATTYNYNQYKPNSTDNTGFDISCYGRNTTSSK